jgi:hypothetical protein
MHACNAFRTETNHSVLLIRLKTKTQDISTLDNLLLNLTSSTLLLLHQNQLIQPPPSPAHPSQLSGPNELQLDRNSHQVHSHLLRHILTHSKHTHHNIGCHKLKNALLSPSSIMYAIRSQPIFYASPRPFEIDQQLNYRTHA